MDKSNSVKHSGYGLISFVLFFFGLIIFFIVVTVKGITASMNYMSSGETLLYIIFEGLFFLWTGPILIISFAGVCFAVAGLLQRGRKKLFSILGLLLNGAGLAVSIALIVLPLFLIK